MSTPNEAWQAAIEEAHQRYSDICWGAGAQLKQDLDTAWYNYRVAAGMVPASEPERQADNDRIEGDGTEAGTEGDSDPVRENGGEASGPEPGDDSGS